MSYITFLSTLSGWRATSAVFCTLLDMPISIHALRVEGDFQPCRPRRSMRNFYPRPPGGGRRLLDLLLVYQQADFYPRPPGGGRPGFNNPQLTMLPIFLSTPSGWRATCGGNHAEMEGNIFLSTPSGWRATKPRLAYLKSGRISIHALRVEGDEAGPGQRHTARAISIHALRVEGDNHRIREGRASNDFYPRPPGGGRLIDPEILDGCCFISIHALRVEGDSKNGQSFHLFLRKREKNLPL